MSDVILETKRPFNWKLFWILWAFSMTAWFLVLPFTNSMIGDEISEMGDLKGFIISVFISNLVVLGASTLLGLAAAGKVGMGLPFVENWLNKSPRWDQFKTTMRTALIVGIVFGVGLIIIDVVVFTPYIEATSGISNANMLNQSLKRASPWQGFLAAISAGVTEEIMFRLLGVSVIAWFGGLFFKDIDRRPKAFVFMIAIVVMSLVFGVAHLQTPSMMGWAMTPAAVIRATLINSIGGFIYGWMYWKKGLESAVMTHFSTDIVLHVFIPIVTMVL